MIDLNNIFTDSIKMTVKLQSNESLINTEKPKQIQSTEKEKEQKNIISEEDFVFKNSFAQSAEADDNTNDNNDDPPQMDDPGFADQLDNADDAMDSGPAEAGGDESSGFGDDTNDSSDQTGGGNGTAGGVDDLDLNKGSSLNTFTQINQKLYHIDTLNKLLASIKTTISRYNDLYTDWSELNQLKDLATIVDEERNSFLMQENPENLIKLRLYQEQYEKIVDRLSILIKEKAKNQKA